MLSATVPARQGCHQAFPGASHHNRNPATARAHRPVAL